MDRTDALFAAVIGSFLVGLGVLLYGEQVGMRSLVFAGSGIVVLSVGLLTAVIAGLDEPSGPEGAP